MFFSSLHLLVESYAGITRRSPALHLKLHFPNLPQNKRQIPIPRNAGSNPKKIPIANDRNETPGLDIAAIQGFSPGHFDPFKIYLPPFGIVNTKRRFQNAEFGMTNAE